MKRTLFLFSLLTVCQFAFSQKVEIKPEGIAPVVISFDSLKANDLYTKAKNWVQESYKNPEKVLKADIPNEKIRVTGFKQKAWYQKTLLTAYFDMEYSLELDFKDGKVRASITPLESWTSGEHTKVLFDYKTFFKDNGDVRNQYRSSKTSMEESINEVIESFVAYVKKKKEDW